MSVSALVPELSRSLEDYLEAILLLVRKHDYARVRDIAAARDVRSASVIAALQKLERAGLIEYHQREYVALTDAGRQAAQRVYARHQVLSRFFHEVLGLAPELAERDACAMEHGLSDEGMDRLVRLFEFLQSCPNSTSTERAFAAFRSCCMAADKSQPLAAETARVGGCAGSEKSCGRLDELSVFKMQPGQMAKVVRVQAPPKVRQRLLDMGMLPDASLEMVRVAPTGNPVWIRLHGSQIALRRHEAEAVAVRAAS